MKYSIMKQHTEIIKIIPNIEQISNKMKVTTYSQTRRPLSSDMSKSRPKTAQTYSFKKLAEILEGKYASIGYKINDKQNQKPIQSSNNTGGIFDDKRKGMAIVNQTRVVRRATRNASIQANKHGSQSYGSSQQLKSANEGNIVKQKQFSYPLGMITFESEKNVTGVSNILSNLKQVQLPKTEKTMPLSQKQNKFIPYAEQQRLLLKTQTVIVSQPSTVQIPKKQQQKKSINSTRNISSAYSKKRKGVIEQNKLKQQKKTKRKSDNSIQFLNLNEDDIAIEQWKDNQDQELAFSGLFKKAWQL